MRVFPDYEFICGDCGAAMMNRNTLTPTIVDGVMRVQSRCTNRGCKVHGIVFVVAVPAIEATEVIDEK